MRGFRGGLGRMLAGALGAISLDFLAPSLPELRFTRRHPNYVPSDSRRTTWHPQHGRQERERRMRQIAAGTLRHENGLDPAVPAMGLTMRQYKAEYHG